MPKGNSGIKRNGGSSRESPKAEASEKRTLEVSENRIDASSPDAIGELREMASHGEVPFSVSGSGEERERFYEEFDRLYPAPPGILNDYRLDTSMGANQIGVFYNYNMAEAESPGFFTYSRRRNTSEAARAGQIKYEIYKTRSKVELALSSRSSGFSNLEMAQKWGGRVLNNSEKAQVNREMESNIRNLLGTPMSQAGKRLNESFWVKSGEGWVRIK